MDSLDSKLMELLVIRPHPILGEATLGYLMRVAEANGYESVRQLWQVVKSPGNLYHALQLSKLEIAYLLGHFPGYWGDCCSGSPFAVSDFNHANLRWCPLCLMESGHIRGLWLLKLYPVCTQHRITLHEQCPNCGNYLSLERPKLDRCPCGTRLTSGNIQAASKNLIHVMTALESAIRDQEIDSALPNLSIKYWLKLALYLGQFTENSQPAKPGQVANLHQLEIAIGLMTNLACLLEDWPKNFHRLLRAIHLRDGSNTGLRRTFGKVINVLYKQLHEGGFQFIRDAFENYLQHNWEGLLCKRHRSFKPETVTAHPQLTVKQAARRAGSTPALVRQLVKAELIPSYQAQPSTHRRCRVIHNNQVRHITTLAKQCVDLQAAAKTLCLPERRIRLLIGMGIIKPLVYRKQQKAASWRIPRKQLAQLWFKPIISYADIKIVGIADVLKYWRLSDEEFVSLVEALIDQTLIPAAGQEKLTAIGNLNLVEEQFRQWLADYRYEKTKTLTVDGASKVLGIKQQVAYELVRSGLLQSDYGQDKGIRINPNHLNDFKLTYVSLAELAQDRLCSPRKLLREIDANPVTGPTVDGNRQYFFRRSEVGSL